MFCSSIMVRLSCGFVLLRTWGTPLIWGFGSSILENSCLWSLWIISPFPQSFACFCLSRILLHICWILLRYSVSSFVFFYLMSLYCILSDFLCSVYSTFYFIIFFKFIWERERAHTCRRAERSPGRLLIVSAEPEGECGTCPKLKSRVNQLSHLAPLLFHF